ncbi:NCS2 family permease [Pelagibaculum spongiae]|uniref:Guanine permease n=1 Tax=Pelagibaculum spongiae TaxID=2080658 RepID=A0A2V1H220_9GAMM|nr:NCS2 family permease [Pelagibaculum spongiae]PVZ68946.1 guanine permease [Pelagibaculum spongiae]
MLEKLFKLSELGSNPRTEIIAGFTTFLTMAYIIFVNPAILADAGMDRGAVFVATCIAAAIGCFIMGLYANYPIAQAPGMGLNAFFTYTVVLDLGYSWEAALGAVFVSGILFVLLSAFKIRQWIINAIPLPLRMGISAGIGFFLALIAFKNSGIVVDNPATLVGLGDLTAVEPMLAALGFFLTIALVSRKIPGAVMIAILLVTIASILLGKTELVVPVSLPPSLAPTFLAMDISAALEIGMLSVVFAFLFVDLFDTSGTLVAVAHRAGLMKKDGSIPHLNKALMSDSLATVAGAALGTSTTTSYIESTSGVAAGGRTGMTACVVGILFLLCLFLSPLAGMIPPYATAGALLYVAVLMTSGLVEINWDDITESAPVVITALAMPLSFSIAEGIALGFISWVMIKAMAGRFKELNISLVVLAVVFMGKYAFF